MSAKKQKAFSNIGDFRVPQLRDATVGIVKNAEIIVSGPPTYRVFVKLDGNIYAVGTSLSLIQKWGSNDAERRAYCKLSGMRFDDIKKACREYVQKQAKANAEYKAANLRIKAKALGYKIVKVKET